MEVSRFAVPSHVSGLSDLTMQDPRGRDRADPAAGGADASEALDAAIAHQPKSRRPLPAR